MPSSPSLRERRGFGTRGQPGPQAEHCLAASSPRARAGQGPANPAKTALVNADEHTREVKQQYIIHRPCEDTVRVQRGGHGTEFAVAFAGPLHGAQGRAGLTGCHPRSQRHPQAEHHWKR